MHARLTLAAIFGLAWWFFGNAYEAVVFSPNWVVDSATQLDRLDAFFVRTSPTVYFVPLTQLATLLVWFVTWRNRRPEAARSLRLASALVAIATAVNVVIVVTTATKLVGEGRATDPVLLSMLTRRWNVLNGLRMALTGACIVALMQAFRRLDRHSMLDGGRGGAGAASGA